MGRKQTKEELEALSIKWKNVADKWEKQTIYHLCMVRRARKVNDEEKEEFHQEKLKIAREKEKRARGLEEKAIDKANKLSRKAAPKKPVSAPKPEKPVSPPKAKTIKPQPKKQIRVIADRETLIAEFMEVEKKELQFLTRRLAKDQELLSRDLAESLALETRLEGEKDTLTKEQTFRLKMDLLELKRKIKLRRGSQLSVTNTRISKNPFRKQGKRSDTRLEIQEFETKLKRKSTKLLDRATRARKVQFEDLQNNYLSWDLAIKDIELEFKLRRLSRQQDILTKQNESEKLRKVNRSIKKTRKDVEILNEKRKITFARGDELEAQIKRIKNPPVKFKPLI